MRIAYGHKISEDGDVYVTIADQAMTGLARAGIFGTYIVDYLPLRKFGCFQRSPWHEAVNAVIQSSISHRGFPVLHFKSRLRDGSRLPMR